MPPPRSWLPPVSVAAPLETTNPSMTAVAFVPPVVRVQRVVSEGERAVVAREVAAQHARRRAEGRPLRGRALRAEERAIDLDTVDEPERHRARQRVRGQIGALRDEDVVAGDAGGERRLQAERALEGVGPARAVVGTRREVRVHVKRAGRGGGSEGEQAGEEGRTVDRVVHGVRRGGGKRARSSGRGMVTPPARPTGAAERPAEWPAKSPRGLTAWTHRAV
jgi:hypothetical protein